MKKIFLVVLIALTLCTGCSVDDWETTNTVIVDGVVIDKFEDDYTTYLTVGDVMMPITTENYHITVQYYDYADEVHECRVSVSVSCFRNVAVNDVVQLKIGLNNKSGIVSTNIYNEGE